MGFLFDLMIGLLFTKSCVLAFEGYQSSKINIFEYDLNDTSAIALSNGGISSDEEEIYTKLLPRDKKDVEGYTYTKLSSDSEG